MTKKTPVRRSRLVLAGLIAASAAATPAWSVDLLQSYQAALTGNADLLAARSAAEAGREALPIARAQLLPNVSLSFSQYRNDLTSTTPDAFGQEQEARQKYGSRSGALVVRQPLYRPNAWAGYQRSQAMVDQAEATLATAQQELGVNVASGYFNLLLARETHLQLQTQIRVIGAQLQAAQRALAAGQATRTDIDDAQARLDVASAKEVAARDAAAQARQELQGMIQAQVDRVRPVDVARLALVPPEPDSEAHWWSLAEQRSPAIATLAAEVRALQADVDRASAGHKPTLDVVAQRTTTDRDSVFNPSSTYRNAQVGVSLNVPLFAGGGVSAQVRQALAALQEGEQRLEAERRKLRNQLRKEFQAVRQGVLRVRAQEQAERSAQQAVISSERGFAAGTRSRLDILNAQQQLSEAVLDLARERLTYLLARIRLQALTGGLDEAAIRDVNQAVAQSPEVDLGESSR